MCGRPVVRSRGSAAFPDASWVPPPNDYLTYYIPSEGPRPPSYKNCDGAFKLCFRRPKKKKKMQVFLRRSAAADIFGWRMSFFLIVAVVFIFFLPPPFPKHQLDVVLLDLVAPFQMSKGGGE